LRDGVPLAFVGRLIAIDLSPLRNFSEPTAPATTLPAPNQRTGKRRPRRPINRARGAESVPVGGCERSAGVAADPRRPCHERTGGESGVASSIVDDQNVRPETGARSEGHVARRRFGARESNVRLEPLLVPGLQAHESHRRAGNARAQLLDAVARRIACGRLRMPIQKCLSIPCRIRASDQVRGGPVAAPFYTVPVSPVPVRA
jgi:hypothetical protein